MEPEQEQEPEPELSQSRSRSRSRALGRRQSWSRSRHDCRCGHLRRRCCSWSACRGRRRSTSPTRARSWSTRLTTRSRNRCWPIYHGRPSRRTNGRAARGRRSCATPRPRRTGCPSSSSPSRAATLRCALRPAGPHTPALLRPRRHHAARLRWHRHPIPCLGLTLGRAARHHVPAQARLPRRLAVDRRRADGHGAHEPGGRGGVGAAARHEGEHRVPLRTSLAMPSTSSDAALKDVVVDLVHDLVEPDARALT